ASLVPYSTLFRSILARKADFSLSLSSALSFASSRSLVRSATINSFGNHQFQILPVGFQFQILSGYPVTLETKSTIVLLNLPVGFLEFVISFFEVLGSFCYFFL